MKKMLEIAAPSKKLSKELLNKTPDKTKKKLR